MIHKNIFTHAIPHHMVYFTLTQWRYVITIKCLCNTKLRHYHKRSVAKINSSALRHRVKETFMLSKKNVCCCGVLGAYLHGPVLLSPKWNTTRESCVTQMNTKCCYSLKEVTATQGIKAAQKQHSIETDDHPNQL